MNYEVAIPYTIYFVVLNIFKSYFTQLCFKFKKYYRKKEKERGERDKERRRKRESESEHN